METHRRKADGRRIFTPQFKQEQLARVSRQELTLPELARELSVSGQLVRQWQRLSSEGSADSTRLTSRDSRNCIASR